MITLDWLDKLQANIEAHRKVNGGPTANPVVGLDANNMQQLITAARASLIPPNRASTRHELPLPLATEQFVEKKPPGYLNRIKG